MAADLTGNKMCQEVAGDALGNQQLGRAGGRLTSAPGPRPTKYMPTNANHSMQQNKSSGGSELEHTSQGSQRTLLPHHTAPGSTCPSTGASPLLRALLSSAMNMCRELSHPRSADKFYSQLCMLMTHRGLGEGSKRKL